jgi:ribosomal protein L40E
MTNNQRMIICPNCNHQNPEGATQCEACYTPLPATTSCPNCGATVQTDATFCGQCGYNLQSEQSPSSEPEPISENQTAPDLEAVPETMVSLPPRPDNLETESSAPLTPPPPLPSQPVSASELESPAQVAAPTQMQRQTASLLHQQTDTKIELPQNLLIIHIGKPNERIPPDIDVSGFPNSEIVSRVHADIRIEADIFYIEDTGSSNGTYINHTPLLPGDRHRLRAGDRISLGKGDKVTFIFQIT